MKKRIGVVAPVALWLLAVVLSLAFLVVAIAGGTSLGDAASALVGVTFSTVGVVIASKRPENRVGWIFLGIGASLGLNGFSFTYADYLREQGSDQTWHWFAWIGTWSWQPGFFLLLPTLFLVFPDGHDHWKRGRTFLKICGVGALASILGTIWSPADLPGDSGYVNPIGIEGLLDVFDALLLIGTLLWTPPALFAAGRGLLLRFRASSGAERQQLKWFVFAGFATLLMYVVGSTLYNLAGSAVGGAIALVGVPLLPIATGVAVFRYRLYEIDRILNRTLVYSALSLLLAGAYLLIVVVLQGALSPLTSDSDLVVAASTLAVAALFRPLRAGVQTFIDHRFYRRKYDAKATLEAFTSRLRDQVDLDSVSEELITAVGMTMQPVHSSLWLREGGAR